MFLVFGVFWLYGKSLLGLLCSFYVPQIRLRTLLCKKIIEFLATNLLLTDLIISACSYLIVVWFWWLRVFWLCRKSLLGLLCWFYVPRIRLLTLFVKIYNVYFLSIWNGTLSLCLLFWRFGFVDRCRVL